MKRRTFLKFSAATSLLSFYNTPAFSKPQIDLYKREFDLISSDKNNNGRFIEKDSSWDIWANRGIVFREKIILKDIETLGELPDTNPSSNNKRASYSQMIYTKNRILYPMKRENGIWTRLDWNEAIDEIVKKIVDNNAVSQPLVYGGGGIALKEYRNRNLKKLQNFLGGFGISQNLRDYEIIKCNYKELFNSNLVIFWGSNPLVTDMENAHFITESRYKGTRLVAITSNFNQTSRICDKWFDMSNQDDIELIKEMIKIELSKKEIDILQIDRTKLKKLKWFENISNFEGDTLEEELIKSYQLFKDSLFTNKNERLKKDADKILLELVSKEKKFILLGHRFNKEFIDYVQFFSILADINIAFSDCCAFYTSFNKQDLDQDLIFEKFFPKIAIIAGDNLFRKASVKFKDNFIKEIDFFVYMDVWVNETALKADIILPIKSDYEIDVKEEGIYKAKNLEDIGEAKSEEEIVGIIMDRLNKLSFEKSSFEEVSENKKKRTYSSLLFNDEKKSFPFKLRVFRSKFSYNSTYRANKTLLRIQRGEPFVEVSKDDAKKLKLRDWDLVRVSNNNGEVDIRIKISLLCQKGNIAVEEGWEAYMFRDKKSIYELFDNSRVYTEVDIKRMSV